jgi:hypothetical protein
VTESEWLASTNPQAMLAFMRDSGRASDRKLRLFAVACCRRIWSLFSDERGRRLVEVIECFAEGAATKERLYDAWNAAARDIHGQASIVARAAAWAATRTNEVMCVARAATRAVAQAEPGREDDGRQTIRHAENIQQCRVLGDIFGNPFHPLGPIDPAWLAWRNGIVRRLAEVAYEERELPSGLLDRQRLLVLADALIDAGCTDAVLLDHLRGPGPHVRGCSVVDLLAGRG